jgi:hypothetical protein
VTHNFGLSADESPTPTIRPRFGVHLQDASRLGASASLTDSAPNWMRAATTKSNHNPMTNMVVLDFNQFSLRFICRIGLLTIGAFNALACNVGSKIGNGVADFGTSLANPDLITVGGPGTRVAQGHFSSPIVDPWDDDGPVIVAFEFKDDGPHLTMRPLSGNSGCGTGIAYSSIVRDKLDNLAQLIAYEEAADADGYGKVHFVDHKCKEYGEPLNNAKLPTILYEDPPGYLLDARDVDARHQLLVVAPWSNKTTVLASDVTWWQKWSNLVDAVAVIDGGHFRIFDARQQLVTDIGTNVTGMVNLPGSSGAFALIDNGKLLTYQSISDTSPVEVASDVCEPVPDSGGCLFFLSPCSERALQCYRADSKQTDPIDTGVQSVVSGRSGTSDGKIAVLYTKKGSQDENSRDLWMFTTGESPQLMLPKFSRLYAWTPPAAEVDALVNADSDIGQVVRHTPAGDTVIIEAVSVNFSQGLLANFDVSRSVGDLYSPVQLGQTPVKIASGVPYVSRQQTIVTSENAATVSYGKATLTNASNAMGDLTLLRYPPTSADGPESPRIIASKVPMLHYRFFEYMNALTYTDEWDADKGVGSLNLYELDLDARTFISDEVREFQEVIWPWVGVMYVVPDGDRAGIWVARAK